MEKYIDMVVKWDSQTERIITYYFAVGLSAWLIVFTIVESLVGVPAFLFKFLFQAVETKSDTSYGGRLLKQFQKDISQNAVDDNQLAKDRELYFNSLKKCIVAGYTRLLSGRCIISFLLIYGLVIKSFYPSLFSWFVEIVVLILQILLSLVHGNIIFHVESLQKLVMKYDEEIARRKNTTMNFLSYLTSE